MKKYIAVFMVFALLLTFVLVVGATEVENAATEGGEVVTAPVEGASGENAADENYASENWFVEVKAWIAENFSGLVVALAALYAIFPKWGGLWVVVRALKKVASLFTALKVYIDDEQNKNSIYNVLKRQGDTMTKFMNDMAPALNTLRRDKESTEALKKELMEAKRMIELQKSVFLAVEEAVELMAAEFNDLISISTTVSQKKKTELEQKWLDAEEHLRKSVKEATGHVH